MVNGHVTSSNTNPAGLRISYAALAIIVTVLLGTGGAIGGLRRADLDRIDKQIETNRITRLEQIAELRSQQNADILRFEGRLCRIEDNLNALMLRSKP